MQFSVIFFLNKISHLKNRQTKKLIPYNLRQTANEQQKKNLNKPITEPNNNSINFCTI